MRSLGKLLQLLGLTFPLLAIVMQLSNAISLGQMLMMLVASLAAFYLGRMIEGYST